MIHSLWCDQPGLESHAVCAALLGTVVVNLDMTLEVRLARHVDTPAVLMLTLADRGRARLVTLNNERLHELDLLLRHGLELITG